MEAPSNTDLTIKMLSATVTSIPPLVLRCEFQSPDKAIAALMMLSDAGVDATLTREGVVTHRYTPDPQAAKRDVEQPPTPARAAVSKQSLPSANASGRVTTKDGRVQAGRRRRKLRRCDELPQATLALLEKADANLDARIGSLARWMQDKNILPENLLGFGVSTAAPLRAVLAGIGYNFEPYVRRRNELTYRVPPLSKLNSY